MPKLHYKKRRKWTKIDVEKLKVFCEKRAKNNSHCCSVLTFATKHRRTEAAVRQKAFQLGFSLT